MEESFVLLARVTYAAEAYVYQGKLESAGIETFLRDNNIVEANPLYSNAVGGVKLYVRSEQLEEAKKILSDISDFSVNDDGTPLECPNCHGKQVEMMTSLKSQSSKWGFFAAVLIGGLPFVKPRYRCRDCHFEFKQA